MGLPGSSKLSPASRALSTKEAGENGMRQSNPWRVLSSPIACRSSRGRLARARPNRVDWPSGVTLKNSTSRARSGASRSAIQPEAREPRTPSKWPTVRPSAFPTTDDRLVRWRGQHTKVCRGAPDTQLERPPWLVVDQALADQLGEHELSSIPNGF